MSAKDFLKLAAILVLFFLAAPYLLRAALGVFHKPQTEVGFTTAVAGQVTGYEMNRQYYLYYLDGNEKAQYDFNAFGPSLASAVTHRSGLTQQELASPGLGAYLKKGDYVTKLAQSTELSVRRGDTTTHWACSPPEFTGQN